MRLNHIFYLLVVLLLVAFVGEFGVAPEHPQHHPGGGDGAA